MNDALLKAKLKSGQPGKFTVDRGLYFRVSEEGNGFWMLRYSINDKRREFVFARYGRPPEGMTLAEARLESARLRVCAFALTSESRHRSSCREKTHPAHHAQNIK